MGYVNPLMKLPAAKRLMALPADQRELLEALLRELRADADTLAEQSWKKRKGPMAAYWRAVSTYARHIAHLLSKGATPEPGAQVPVSAARTPQELIAAMDRGDLNGQEAGAEAGCCQVCFDVDDCIISRQCKANLSPLKPGPRLAAHASA